MIRNKQTAATCLECGTRGGSFEQNRNRPWRCRGYCRRCYYRLYARGEFTGDLRRTANGNDAYPPNVSREYVMCHTVNGERHAHPLPFRADYCRATVEAEAEAFAAAWLAAHPEHAAKYAPLAQRAKPSAVAA